MKDKPQKIELRNARIHLLMIINFDAAAPKTFSITQPYSSVSNTRPVLNKSPGVKNGEIQ